MILIYFELKLFNLCSNLKQPNKNNLLQTIFCWSTFQHITNRYRWITSDKVWIITASRNSNAYSRKQGKNSTTRINEERLPITNSVNFTTYQNHSLEHVSPILCDIPKLFDHPENIKKRSDLMNLIMMRCTRSKYFSFNAA